MIKEKKYTIKDISSNTLNDAYNKAIVKDNTYKDENDLIRDVLKKYPLNNDLNIVAMKIALIDVTNSTHLHQYKKDINLFALASFICNKTLDFDKKVKSGEDELVKSIANNTGKKNLFSFASKYCFYHNTMVYNKDDYAKFDGVVKECLPLYALKYRIKYNNKIITSGTLETLRKNCNYKDFNGIVNDILKDITLENKKAKFDALMWYYNRTEQNKIDNA